MSSPRPKSYRPPARSGAFALSIDGAKGNVVSPSRGGVLSMRTVVVPALHVVTNREAHAMMERQRDQQQHLPTTSDLPRHLQQGHPFHTTGMIPAPPLSHPPPLLPGASETVAWQHEGGSQSNSRHFRGSASQLEGQSSTSFPSELPLQGREAEPSWVTAGMEAESTVDFMAALRDGVSSLALSAESALSTLDAASVATSAAQSRELHRERVRLLRTLAASADDAGATAVTTLSDLLGDLCLGHAEVLAAVEAAVGNGRRTEAPPSFAPLVATASAETPSEGVVSPQAASPRFPNRPQPTASVMKGSVANASVALDQPEVTLTGTSQAPSSRPQHDARRRQSFLLLERAADVSAHEGTVRSMVGNPCDLDRRSSDSFSVEDVATTDANRMQDILDAQMHIQNVLVITRSWASSEQGLNMAPEQPTYNPPVTSFGRRRSSVSGGLLENFMKSGGPRLPGAAAAPREQQPAHTVLSSSASSMSQHSARVAMLLDAVRSESKQATVNLHNSVNSFRELRHRISTLEAELQKRQTLSALSSRRHAGPRTHIAPNSTTKSLLAPPPTTADDTEFLVMIAFHEANLIDIDLSIEQANAVRSLFRRFCWETAERCNATVAKEDSRGNVMLLSCRTAAEAISFERCFQYYSAMLPWKEVIEQRGSIPRRIENSPTQSHLSETTLRRRASKAVVSDNRPSSGRVARLRGVGGSLLLRAVQSSEVLQGGPTSDLAHRRSIQPELSSSDDEEEEEPRRDPAGGRRRFLTDHARHVVLQTGAKADEAFRLVTMRELQTCIRSIEDRTSTPLQTSSDWGSSVSVASPAADETYGLTTLLMELSDNSIHHSEQRFPKWAVRGPLFRMAVHCGSFAEQARRHRYAASNRLLEVCSALLARCPGGASVISDSAFRRANCELEALNADVAVVNNAQRASRAPKCDGGFSDPEWMDFEAASVLLHDFDQKRHYELHWPVLHGRYRLLREDEERRRDAAKLFNAFQTPDEWRSMEPIAIGVETPLPLFPSYRGYDSKWFMAEARRWGGFGAKEPWRVTCAVSTQAGDGLGGVLKRASPASSRRRSSVSQNATDAGEALPTVQPLSLPQLTVESQASPSPSPIRSHASRGQATKSAATATAPTAAAPVASTTASASQRRRSSVSPAASMRRSSRFGAEKSDRGTSRECGVQTSGTMLTSSVTTTKHLLQGAMWMIAWADGSLSESDVLQNLYETLDPLSSAAVEATTMPADSQTSVELGPAGSPRAAHIGSPTSPQDNNPFHSELSWADLQRRIDAPIERYHGEYYGGDDRVNRAAVAMYFIAIRDTLRELGLYRRRRTVQSPTPLVNPLGVRHGSLQTNVLSMSASNSSRNPTPTSGNQSTTVPQAGGGKKWLDAVQKAVADPTAAVRGDRTSPLFPSTHVVAEQQTTKGVPVVTAPPSASKVHSATPRSRRTTLNAASTAVLMGLGDSPVAADKRDSPSRDASSTLGNIADEVTPEITATFLPAPF